jgi:iron complex transport system ATP-binding protein
MSALDVGIEGVQLVIDREAVLVSSERPLTICSSALVGGGIVSCSHIINMHVPKGYSSSDPAADLREFARRRGIDEPFIGLITAAWTHEAKPILERADGITVVAVATVGLSNTIAAGLSPAAACVPSTINTIVLIDGSPGPGALVNAVITATEAKALVLADAGITTAEGWQASGTSTDAVVVAATGRGKPFNFGGPVADGGWLIARAVRLAIEAGITGQKVGS